MNISYSMKKLKIKGGYKMSSIMLQGTGSDVGKSVLVAGICRALTNRGMKVRPFKAQNMSNNAAPTIDGGEIGRAQALQAMACRVAPTTDMNPILLKPQSNLESQVIVRGKVYGNLQAKDFITGREPLLEMAMESFRKLESECDIVIAEGGGSPAEINLRSGDIVNMGFARPANMPVILVGDINRGGVIASLVGTKTVLDKEDADMIKGFLVNQFRGDIGLFEEGNLAVEKMTGWKGLGIVPWLTSARKLPAEDAITKEENKEEGIVIAVPVLPHISNFDDFDALRAEDEIELVYVYPNQPLPANAKLVILPGSKTTINDLEFFKKQGWDIDLKAHLRRGGYVMGICGGYQMLGKTIEDSLGIEGEPRCVEGLNLLDIHTILSEDKRVLDVKGVSLEGEIPFYGYEIHCGSTELEEGVKPLVRLENGVSDGAISKDGQVFGCYIHRLFDHPAQRAYWMKLLGAKSDGFDQQERIEQALDEMAMELEKYVDIDEIIRIAEEKN